jgi:LuxR family maltose regulon positive regulatory protein
MAGRRALTQLAGTDWGSHLDAAQQALLRAAAAPAYTTLPAGGVAAATTAGPLTARETDVLARLAAGDSNKLIARALDLSPHTVKRHVANILDKLGLNSRGQAAAWYRSH